MQNKTPYNNKPSYKKPCFFCQQNIKVIDYKNSDVLRKFTSSQAKIAKRIRTGTCAHHQHKVGRAIKRARFMALLPNTAK